MALLVSGIVCEIREVKLRDKPAEMIAASPKATVPVLVLAETVIDESIDIMRWVLRQSDPEQWLDGDDHALIAANDGPFKTHLDRYKYPDRHGSDPIAHRAEALAILAGLDLRLASQSHLCGDRRMLTDAAILPFVRQFAAVDPGWFDAQPIPGVRRWLAEGLASPLFVQAMAARPQWRAGDSPVYLA